MTKPISRLNFGKPNNLETTKPRTDMKEITKKMTHIKQRNILL